LPYQNILLTIDKRSSKSKKANYQRYSPVCPPGGVFQPGNPEGGAGLGIKRGIVTYLNYLKTDKTETKQRQNRDQTRTKHR
jgi:hypothetical protein